VESPESTRQVLKAALMLLRYAGDKSPSYPAGGIFSHAVNRDDHKPFCLLAELFHEVFFISQGRSWLEAALLLAGNF